MKKYFYLIPRVKKIKMWNRLSNSETAHLDISSIKNKPPEEELGRFGKKKS